MATMDNGALMAGVMVQPEEPGYIYTCSLLKSFHFLFHPHACHFRSSLSDSFPPLLERVKSKQIYDTKIKGKPDFIKRLTFFPMIYVEIVKQNA